MDTSGWVFSPDKDSAIGSLGIAPFRAPVYAELAHVEKGSAADLAGLKVQDKLITINNERINGDWQKFSKKISELPEQNVILTIERSGEYQQMSVTPSLIDRI